MKVAGIRWWLLAFVLLAALLVANARFIRLAFDFQAECVPHATKSDAGSNTHRAAKSSC